MSHSHPPGLLFVIAACSGTGKSTVCQHLLERSDQFQLSISYTTRPPRGQEQDGREYHFVDRQHFQQMIAYN
ncbi:MAG: guanylate kinase, partial [Myxococcota bacterium]